MIAFLAFLQSLWPFKSREEQEEAQVYRQYIPPTLGLRIKQRFLVWLHKGVKLPEQKFGVNSVTLGDLITMDTQAPGAVGQIGMNAATGRLQLYIDSAARDVLGGHEVIIPGGTTAFTGNQSMGGNLLTDLGTPVSTTDAATKDYVDVEIAAVAAGLDPKGSVKVASQGLIENEDGVTPTYSSTGGDSARGQITWGTGPTAVDSQDLSDGDRILLRAEGSGTQEQHGVDTIADAGGSLDGTYFIFYATPSKAFYVWYAVGGFANTDPNPTPPAGVSYTGVQVDITAGDAADVVASQTEAALLDTNKVPNNSLWYSVSRSTNELTILNAHGGFVTNVADGVTATSFTFATDTDGDGLLGPDANGIWVRTSANTWDRAEDFDSDADVSPGAYMPVESGTDAGFMYILTTTVTVTLGGAGGTPLTFSKFGINDHGALTGLADDDHTQYMYLTGRAGGQTLQGGNAATEALTLESTSHATKGAINVASGSTLTFLGDDLVTPGTDNQVSFGAASPGTRFKAMYAYTIQSGDHEFADHEQDAMWVMFEEKDRMLIYNAKTGKCYTFGLTETKTPQHFIDRRPDLFGE